jgi:FixJ family two-component response regulator
MSETIAVVDPDPAVRHSLEFALQMEGYRVATFARGQDLLTAMREPPACLISEYRLADMTGFDLVEKIREIRRDVHFVLLVTYPDRSILRRAQAENARVVEKPLLGNTLLDEIRRLQA